MATKLVQPDKESDNINNFCNEDENINNESDTTSDTSKLLFKCCAKKCSVVVCINCYSVFHKSCSERILNNKKLQKIDDNKVICCEGVNPLSYNSNDQNVKFQMEINLLKKLLLEMEDKNTILKENNGLLLDKIKYLQEKKTAVKTDGRNINSQPVVQKTSADQPGHSSVSYSTALKTQMSESVHNTQTNKYTVAQTNTVEPPKLSNHETNVTITSQDQTQSTDENGFQTQRRKKSLKKRFGTGTVTNEQENGFVGEERRVWLYINRVKRHVTSEMILKFIKEKQDFGDENVQVKEIPNHPNSLKRFVVTAPLTRKDELYEPEFWPARVGIKRFDFGKHREFLKQGGDFL